MNDVHMAEHRRQQTDLQDRLTAVWWRNVNWAKRILCCVVQRLYNSPAYQEMNEWNGTVSDDTNHWCFTLDGFIPFGLLYWPFG